MAYRSDLDAAHARIAAARAFYLERELERRLGITDRPVEGELPRRE